MSLNFEHEKTINLSYFIEERNIISKKTCKAINETKNGKKGYLIYMLNVRRHFQEFTP